MKYSIVIPCYNEEQNLSDLVDSLYKIPKKYNIEFILVENGSKDNSRALIKKLKKIDGKRIKTTNVNINQGYGYGLKQGLKISTGDYVGWIHADMQVNPNEIIKYVESAEENPNKKVLYKGLRSNRTFMDNFFTFNMSIFETILFKTYLHDIGAIPVLFPKELLTYFNDAPNDFAIELYTYVIAKKHGYKIIRKKVNMNARKKGHSSWNTGLSSKIKQSKKIINASYHINSILRKKEK